MGILDQDTKPKGWFSRRHQTSEAHEEAVARYQAHHGPEARRLAADPANRLRDRETMFPGMTQKQVLDDRLGTGQGARKERARLRESA